MHLAEGQGEAGIITVLVYERFGVVLFADWNIGLRYVLVPNK